MDQVTKTVKLLEKEFSSEILNINLNYDIWNVDLKADKIIEIINFLYNLDGDNSFKFLTTLCGIHYPQISKIAMMYQLYNLIKKESLRLKVYLDETKPEIPTLTNLFKAANWMERETFDFFGVKFTNHPNLKRILNVEEMLIFPMRKEYPLEDQSREDKEDSFFGRKKLV